MFSIIHSLSPSFHFHFLSLHSTPLLLPSITHSTLLLLFLATIFSLSLLISTSRTHVGISECYRKTKNIMIINKRIDLDLCLHFQYLSRSFHHTKDILLVFLLISFRSTFRRETFFEVEFDKSNLDRSFVRPLHFFSHGFR